jgi:HSP20 family protein
VRKDVKTLGQILSGLGDLLDGLSGLAETGADVLERVGSRTGRTARVTYGWSIGPAAGPRPRHRPDGGDAPPPERPQPPRGADAVQETFDEGDFLRTVIEVPGVVDGDIQFHVTGQEITIDARRHDGRRVIRLRVPAPVLAEGATSSYRNGMFEIRLPKRRDPHGSR